MELTLNMKSMKFILMTKRLNRDLSHTIETGWIIRLNSFSNQAAVLSWLCDIEFIKTKPRRIFGKRVKEKKRNRPSVKSEVATLAPVSLGPAPGRRLCASIDRRPRLIVVDLSLSLSLSISLSTFGFVRWSSSHRRRLGFYRVFLFFFYCWLDAFYISIPFD